MLNTLLNRDECIMLPSEAKQLPTLRLVNDKPLHILLIEDESSDVMLTDMSLASAGIDYQLYALQDGLDVLPFLNRAGKYTHMPKPDVIMLDLSLPAKDGFEVLDELAMQSARFGAIPIIILTGDRHCAFLKRSHELNVAAYLTKPCSPVKMRDAFDVIASML